MRTPLLTFLSAAMMLSLASCGGVTKPTTPHEKVRYALNGVESSFQQKKVAGKNAYRAPKGRFVGSGEQGALDTIFGLYGSGDVQQLDLDDISYNQPPMVQFQYLKKVFDRIGDSFAFGTKYYDEVQGEVFVDLETGYQKEAEDAYRCRYNFGFALDLSIDANDFITADVSFDITVIQGDTAIHAQWYVGMDLIYDMNGDSPTYTMLMITRADEREVPFRAEMTYEYDYVDVKQGAIQEWRKYDIGTSEPLVRDQAHSDFNSYSSKDGFSFRVGNCAWLRDGTFRKFTRMDDVKANNVANAMFTGLGLNDTAINPSPFISKQSSPNGAIKEIYNEFTQMRGHDIFYDLFCKDEDDHGGHQQSSYSEIVLFAEDLETRMGNFAVGDVTLHDVIFGHEDPISQEWQEYYLYYLDQNGGLANRIMSLDGFEIYFGCQAFGADKEINISYHEILANCFNNYKQAFFPNEPMSEEGRAAFMRIVDRNNGGVSGVINFVYVGNQYPTDESSIASWPSDWSSIDVTEPAHGGHFEQFGDTVIVDGVTSKDWRLYLDYLQGNHWFTRGILDNDARSECFRDFENGNGQYILEIVNNGPSKESNGYVLNFTLRHEDVHPLYTVNGIGMSRNDEGLFVTVIGPLSVGQSLLISRDSYGDVTDVHAKPDENNNLDEGLCVRASCNQATVYYDSYAHEFFLEGYQSGEGPNPYEIDVLAVTLCGSFNNWDESSTSHTLNPTEEEHVYRGQYPMSSGDKFKVLVNWSWEIGGGFGFNCFDDSVNQYSKYFAEDTYDTSKNISVIRDCMMDLQVTLSFSQAGVGATLTIIDAKGPQ